MCSSGFTLCKNYADHGLRSEVFVAFNLTERMQLIGGTWYGSLAQQGISEEDGYWLIVSEAADLEVQGAPTAPVVYTLHEGNNLISYPYAYVQNIEDAFAGTTAEGNVLAVYGNGEAGALIDGAWSGDLTEFEGGKGYWINVSEPIILNFYQP